MAELSKEAIQAIIAEYAPQVIEAWVQQNFNMDAAGIQQQFAIVNSASANAAQARLGSLLGLQGQDLINASNKLLEYYEGLAPHERDKYQADEAVVSLWQSMNPESSEAPAPDATRTGEGQRTYKQSEIEEMSLEDFRAQEEAIQAAYLSGQVVLDTESKA